MVVDSSEEELVRARDGGRAISTDHARRVTPNDDRRTRAARGRLAYHAARVLPRGVAGRQHDGVDRIRRELQPFGELIEARAEVERRAAT